MHGLKAITEKRGSSVIMVLIAMTFIAILGTILMFSAFTGFQIKAAQAKGDNTFYSAETALDEVRAGIQRIASDSIASAYQQMLLSYVDSESFNAEAVFAANFDTLFRNSGIINNVTLRYDITELQKFIIITDNAEIITAELNRTFVIEPDRFIFKNVSIRHRSWDGFVSTVTSDIIVMFPDFTYIHDPRKLDRISEFALIATGELRLLATGNLNIAQGNAYTGNVNNNGSLSVSDGMFISRGDVEINNGGSMTVTALSDLWARRVLLGRFGTGSVNLFGNTYIADDLELRGDGAYARLTGNYYGFGNSLDVASESSSIIVNALNSTLDMSGLTELFIAGQSFIHNDNIFTGQSVSVKGDQLAYLVPTEFIRDPVTNNSLGMNPIIFLTANDKPAFTVTGGINYHEANSAISIGGLQYTLLFLFVAFNDEDEAISHFEKYFNDYPGEIQSFLNSYIINPSLPGNSLTGDTSGVYYTMINGVLTLRGGDTDRTAITRRAGLYGNSFSNLTRSLSAQIQMNTDITPYQYIYDTMFNEIMNNEHAVFINCGRTSLLEIIEFYGDVDIIMSPGNITIDDDFTGLIISNGDIIVNNTRTIQASEPVHEDIDVVYGSWNMNALVHYENWSKS